jgi:hypothetical protein
MDEDNKLRAPEGFYERRRKGEPNTPEDREYNAARRRRARANKRAKIEQLEEELAQKREADQEARDERRADDTEPRIARIFAKVAEEDRSKHRPGVPIPLDDPADIQARNEAFDRERERCERWSILVSRRTLYALTHNIPGGWSNSEVDESVFPFELRLARLKDEQA